MHVSPPLILASCLVYKNRHSADVANALNVIEFWLWRYLRCHTRDTNPLVACSCYTLCMHVSPPLILASCLVYKNRHSADVANALNVVEFWLWRYLRCHTRDTNPLVACSCYTLCMHVSPPLILASCLVVMNRQPADGANAHPSPKLCHWFACSRRLSLNLRSAFPFLSRFCGGQKKKELHTK
jgi:hypothetical protein